MTVPRCRNHAMQSRLRPHDALRSALGKIIFDQVGKFMVHHFRLGFVYSNHKGSQPEADRPVLLVKPDHAACASLNNSRLTSPAGCPALSAMAWAGLNFQVNWLAREPAPPGRFSSGCGSPPPIQSGENHWEDGSGPRQAVQKTLSVISLLIAVGGF